MHLFYRQSLGREGWYQKARNCSGSKDANYWDGCTCSTTYLRVGINVIDSRREWYICAVEDTFASRLAAVKVDQPRFCAQDGYIQHISHSQVISVEDTTNDVGLFALDEVFDSFDGLGTVQQVSGQAHVMLLEGRGRAGRERPCYSG